MQKLEGKTFNVVQDNVEKLKQLFPEVFTDSKVDIDKLRLALGENIEKEKELYEFTWNGKTEAIQLAQKQTTGTLLPCVEESVNWDKTKNLYIEGDNLEVLRLLQNSYRNKIKMIYIDPPYNTGKDFIYKDDFHDNVKSYKERMNEQFKTNSETNGRYHTDWLNMIYPRLKIAKNLLREDGGIFISIDDHELNNLKKICDEIYGEENFVGQIAVVNNLKGRNDSKNLATCHEYLLIYGKKDFLLNGLPLSDEQKAEFNLEDENGEKYQLRDLRKRGRPDRREDRPNMYFPIFYNPNDKTCSLKPMEGAIEIFPLKGDGTDGRWRWGKERVERNLHRLEPFFSSKSQRWGIRTRIYLNNGLNDIGINDGTDEENEETGMERTAKSKSFWLEPSHSTDVAQRQIKNLFGYSPFDYPKSVELIKRIIYLGSNPNDIILDFFAGSGTTAQAVMEINGQESTDRRFILVQIPEKLEGEFSNLSEIGRERIKLYSTKANDESDKGFKLFKLDDTNLKIWDEETDTLEKNLFDSIESVKIGRTQEDVVYEILLKYGIDLTVPIEKTEIAGKSIYSVGLGYLLICLERDLTLEHIEELGKQKPARIVFYDDGFKDDTVRTNAQQILKRYDIEDIRVI